MLSSLDRKGLNRRESGWSDGVEMPLGVSWKVRKIFEIASSPVLTESRVLVWDRMLGVRW